jgi:probable HAF family extracellular repeat protein
VLRSVSVKKYRVTEIGTLPGGTYSFASAVNNYGAAVGWGDTVLGPGETPVVHAFYRDPKTGILKDLHLVAPSLFDGPESRALDINDFGDVVGWFRIADGEQRGFLWGALGMQALPVLQYNGPGSYNVTANAINDFGVVAGTSGERPGALFEGHAFVWGSFFNSPPLDLNPKGYSFTSG